MVEPTTTVVAAPAVTKDKITIDIAPNSDVDVLAVDVFDPTRRNAEDIVNWGDLFKGAKIKQLPSLGR